jgi:hypothetical protein
MIISRVALFLGSGVSYASFQPFGNDAGTVKNISKRLFNEPWQNVAGRFVPPVLGVESIFLEAANRAKGMLRHIKGEVDAHLRVREGREGHYEDLYAAALQIFQDESHEITSPLIARSIADLRLTTAPHYVGYDSSFVDSFTTLVKYSLDLIQSVVLTELQQAVDPIKLERISEIAKACEQLDIFTLNHDSLVEKQLTSSGIPFADGFGDRRSGYRIFNGHWPDGPGVRILKLHGALNWYYCIFKRMRQYAILEASQDKCFDDDGSRFWIKELPEFLTGTTVKEQSYGHSLIGEVFARFRQLSSQHRKIITCGYGWHDKGINLRIDQWLNDRPENKLIILHGGELETMLKVNFWWRRWDKYHSSDKVAVHPKWLCDCSLSEIQSLLK